MTAKAKAKTAPKAKTVSAEKKLKEMGITLPTLAAPMANYVPYVQTGKLVFLSGQGPRRPEGGLHTGKVGIEVSTDDAYKHARLVGISLLATLKDAVGSLDKVKRVVKVLGMVNSGANFAEHPRVINGCSDLFAEVFGDKGKHARSAVGMGSLPGNITVEIEAIFEVA